MIKKALLTGITGQDGSYLAELLLSKNYEVHGIVRRSSTINTPRIDHLIENKEIFGKTLFTHYGDLTDANNINELVAKIAPNELYNLGAMSHVKISFDQPGYTLQVGGVGTLNILEAVKNHSLYTKIYQASTSEMFGGMGFNMPKEGYNEQSSFFPRSPYGVSKVTAYWMTRLYRDAYNMFASNGLLFNHESPRRGETFVTRKITIWCAKNYERLKERYISSPLELGNINAHRDWGHAKDYAYAQYLILQKDKADDYVISSGETHTIREFVEKCFKFMDLSLTWEGEGENEVGICGSNIVVKINPKYYRPSEVDYLLGDSSKARTLLNWKPQYTFDGLIEDMMRSDMRLYGKE